MIDPYAILDQQYEQQSRSIGELFGQQELQVRHHFQGLLGNLHRQYEVERSYISGDAQQKQQKLGQLNRKYELKILQLQQQAQPHLTELEQRRTVAQGKLDTQRQELTHRFRVIDELARKGAFADPVFAMQEQLQALNVSLPISALRGPSRESQLQDLQRELSAVDSMLQHFRPPTEKGWGRKPLRFTPTTYDDELQKATPEQAEEFNALMKHRETVRQSLRTLLTERGLAPFSRAVETAKNLRTPFGQGVASLKPKPRKTDRYGVGQIVKKGGKSWRIVGFNDAGEPLVEEAR